MYNRLLFYILSDNKLRVIYHYQTIYLRHLTTFDFSSINNYCFILLLFKHAGINNNKN